MGPGGPSQLRDSAGMVLAGRELHRLRYLRAVRHPSTAELCGNPPGMFICRFGGQSADMAAADSGESVLTTLDDRVPTAFYWQLTLLATLGGFLFGYDTSNIGSALNFVPYSLQGPGPGLPGVRRVARRGRGRAAGRADIGPFRPQAAAGHRRGHLRHRRHLVRGDAGRGVLLIARTLIGLAIGADSAIATAYIAEYAPKEQARVAGHAAAVDDHGRHPGRPTSSR